MSELLPSPACPAAPSPATSWAQMLDPQDPPVVLATTLTVDGMEFAYGVSVDPRAWERISRDPAIRAGYEHSLRLKLAESIVERLAPPVTVQMPPALDETGARTGQNTAHPN
ncbi:hypothetical protein [Streptomyces similanensis]|uniref:Uncharacterized protein n=1 Tax=Streptomyces similanensis TaxID=1274988 RepID=A0ABP9L874_9ACTN